MPFHVFRYVDKQAFRFNERKNTDTGRFLRDIHRPKPKMSDRQRLLHVAKLVRFDLEGQDEAAQILWRIPFKCIQEGTDGWRIRIGSLPRGRPFLELWLDRYTRREERYFWFGFCSPNRQAIKVLFQRAADNLQPTKTILAKNTERTGKRIWQLSHPLKMSDFGKPTFEHYLPRWKEVYYGMYNPALSDGNHYHQVARRAAAFFLDVLHTLSSAPRRTSISGIYPRIENRKVVVRHVERERDGLLAVDCKIRDKYKCRICGMRFEDVYGVLGREFAEAHHIIPLSKLKRTVHSTVNDLITVCSNCHRMLHKMDGKRSDRAKLRKITRRQKM